MRESEGVPQEKRENLRRRGNTSGEEEYLRRRGNTSGEEGKPQKREYLRRRGKTSEEERVSEEKPFIMLSVYKDLIFQFGSAFSHLYRS